MALCPARGGYRCDGRFWGGVGAQGAPRPREHGAQARRRGSLQARARLPPGAGAADDGVEAGRPTTARSRTPASATSARSNRGGRAPRRTRLPHAGAGAPDPRLDGAAPSRRGHGWPPARIRQRRAPVRAWPASASALAEASRPLGARAWHTAAPPTPVVAAWCRTGAVEPLDGGATHASHGGLVQAGAVEPLNGGWIQGARGLPMARQGAQARQPQARRRRLKGLDG
jgi:hypothetical protein